DSKAHNVDFDGNQEQYFDELNHEYEPTDKYYDDEPIQYYDSPCAHHYQMEQDEIELQAANYQNERQNGYQNSYQDKQKYFEQRRNKAKQEGRCYKCHETGHMIAKCPRSNNQAVLTKDGAEKQSGNGSR